MNSLRFIPRNALWVVGTAAILSLTVAAQAAEGWVVDSKKAQAQAAKEGKSILMEFTGSDWCPPCKALQKNVLSKDVFKTEMPKSFVLLKLDSPRDKSKQTPEEIEQYKVLSAKYGIQGVPTIFLADAKGRPYYQTVGYSGDPADKYVANLKDQLGTLAKRDAAFAKAEKASGTEKAKLLAEGLSLVDDEMALKTYGNVVSQIIELDADNKAGLKAKFAGLKDSVSFKSELEDTMRSNSTKPEDTLAAIDKLIEEKKPTGAALQEAVFMKSSILFQTDKAKAKEMLIEAQKLAPKSETGKRIDDILERFFKDE